MGGRTSLSLEGTCEIVGQGDTHMALLPHPTLTPIPRPQPHTPPSTHSPPPDPHTRSLLEGTCGVVRATLSFTCCPTPPTPPIFCSHPRTPPSPGPHYRSLLEATCEIVKATPYDAGRLFGAYFVKVVEGGDRVYFRGALCSWMWGRPLTFAIYRHPPASPRVRASPPHARPLVRPSPPHAPPSGCGASRLRQSSRPPRPHLCGLPMLSQ